MRVEVELKISSKQTDIMSGMTDIEYSILTQQKD